MNDVNAIADELRSRSFATKARDPLCERAADEIDRLRKSVAMLSAQVAVTRAQHDHAHAMLMRLFLCRQPGVGQPDDAYDRYRIAGNVAYGLICEWRDRGITMPIDVVSPDEWPVP